MLRQLVVFINNTTCAIKANIPFNDGNMN